MHPKHDGVVPQITPLDDEAQASFDQVNKLGIPTQIKGKFNIQLPANPLMDVHLSDEIQVIAFSNIPEEFVPIRAEYLNQDSEIIFTTNYANLKLIQRGTDIRRYSGVDNKNFINYLLTLYSNSSGKIDLSITSLQSTPENVISNLRKASRIKVILLEHDYSTIFDIPAR
jgi:hypothetical protein